MAKSAKKPTIVERSKELVSSAKKRKSAKDGLPCVMFLKGAEKGGVLLALRGKPIPKADVLEQRKPFKGGPVYRGVCYGIDGGLAFELYADPSKNKLPNEPKLKKVVNSFLETKYKTITARLVPLTEMADDLKADFGDLMDDVDDTEDGVPVEEEQTAAPQDDGAQDQAESSSETAQSEREETHGDDAARTKKLTEALNKLTPLVKKALKASPDSKDELLQGVKAGHDALKGGELDEAAALVKALGAKIQAILTGQAPPEESSQEDDQIGSEAAFKARLRELAPRAQEAIRARSGDVSAMRTILAFVQEKAGEGDFERALKALERLEGMLEPEETSEEASTEDGVSTERATPQSVPSVVPFRQALLKFRLAYTTVNSRIETLRSQIEDTLPDEAELAQALEERLAELTDELQDTIDDAIAQTSNVDNPVDVELITQLRSYKEMLGSDPLVQHVDANPFVPTRIAPELTQALNQIESAVPVQ